MSVRPVPAVLADRRTTSPGDSVTSRSKGQTAPPPVRSDDRFPYLAQLPPKVPPIEGPFDEKYPSQTIGPTTITYYFPIPLDGCNPTGVFFPQRFGFNEERELPLLNPRGSFLIVLGEYVSAWKRPESPGKARKTVPLPVPESTSSDVVQPASSGTGGP